MTIKKIRLVPNYRKKWAVKLIPQITAFLKKHGYVIAHTHVDITICIGGDGTIFYANHQKRIQGVILGLGSHTSALCIIRKDNWKRKIIPLLKNARKEKRLTLQLGVGKKHYTALNDIVVHTHDYRVITLFVKINEEQHTFEGDGVIISTPSGSTAYAYSAGGKILTSRARKIQIVPICPYKRTIKPMVVLENSTIEIFADRSSDLIIDGIYLRRLEPKKKIIITKGKNILFLK